MVLLSPQVDIRRDLYRFQKKKISKKNRLSPYRPYEKISTEFDKIEIKPEDLIGKGSYSSVYKCIYKDQPAAIKLSKTCDDRDLIDMKKDEYFVAYLNECQEHKKWKHKPIVRLLGSYEWYHPECRKIHKRLIYERCNRTLKQLMRSNGYKGLSIDKVYRIAKGILRGMILMEEQGIVHGDLSHRNVMVIKEKGKLVTRIIDLGMSFFKGGHRLSNWITQICFRAPEVLNRPENKFYPGWDNDLYGHGVDRWAFGIHLYYMLINKFPFPAVKDDRKTESELIKHIKEVIGDSKHTKHNSSALEREFYQPDGVAQRLSSGIKICRHDLDSKLGSEVVDKLVTIMANVLRWDPKERWSPTKCLAALKKAVPKWVRSNRSFNPLVHQRSRPRTGKRIFKPIVHQQSGHRTRKRFFVRPESRIYL